MADQSVGGKLEVVVPASLTAEAAQVLEGSDYSPSAGDVAEFDDPCRIRQKGIVFIDDDKDLIVTHESNWHQIGVCRNFVKVGSTNCIPDGTKSWKGKDIAKAYFSTPQFKVEARHEAGVVVEFRHINRDCIGVIAPDFDIACVIDGNEHSVMQDEAENIRVTGEVVKGLTNWESALVVAHRLAAPATYTADPDKSYAENQAAAVKFYGWVEGSKVKVVRKFKENEAGCFCAEWDWDTEKAGLQGKVITIEFINKKSIQDGYKTFPYFALQPA